MSSAADLASRVLHAITTGEIRKETGFVSYSESKSAPVSTQALQHVADTLDRSIADAKV